MTEKIYLSTPMNGKTEEEIQAALQCGIDWCLKNGYEYYSPYNPDNAEFVKGKVSDPHPITMLAKSLGPMDDCTGLMYIGSNKDYMSSKGCRVEFMTAKLYNKRVFADLEVEE